MSEKPWFEVWVEKRRGATPYLRVLLQEEGRFTIYDLAKRRILLDSDTYQTAADALIAEGFSVVSGRTDFSAGAALATV